MKTIYEYVINQKIKPSDISYSVCQIDAADDVAYVAVWNLNEFNDLIDNGGIDYKLIALEKLRKITDELKKENVVLIRPSRLRGIAYIRTFKDDIIDTDYKETDKITAKDFSPEYWEKHHWTI